MAEHGVGNAVSAAAAGVVIARGTKSDFAQSLLSASFDQVMNGYFYWQFSDMLTLICSAVVILNFADSMIEKIRQRRANKVT